jgi:hypothetical protein
MLKIKLRNGKEVSVKPKTTITIQLEDGSFVSVDRFAYYSSSYNHRHDENIELKPSVVKLHNSLNDQKKRLISQSQGTLQNAVQNEENKLATLMLKNIMKKNNAFDSQDDVITKQQKQQAVDGMIIILMSYYLLVFPLYGNQLLNQRQKEFGIASSFVMTAAIKGMITALATKAAESHVNTIVNDVLSAAKGAYDSVVAGLEQTIRDAGQITDDSEIFKLAQEEALKGSAQSTIISRITTTFQNVSQTRAKTIARTETNRAFTTSQYEADKQFLNDNDLMDSAYKVWETNSADPCPFCLELEANGQIPFDQPFVADGDTIDAEIDLPEGGTKSVSMLVNYGDVYSGNAHVNCSCDYMLIIDQGGTDISEDGVSDPTETDTSDTGDE